MYSYGIDGMEVYYQKYSISQISRLNSLAESYKLYKTVGTDYHNSPDEAPKNPKYAQARKKERIAFDVVEPDAGVWEIFRKLTDMGGGVTG